jgi:DNA polymerase-3 subunit delta'
VTSLVGNAAAQTAFRAAIDGGTLHHAWLIVGPQGVGKGTFARLAALRLLAEAASPEGLAPGLAVPDGHAIRSLFEAGSHPDYRLLARLPRDADKPEGDQARSITIAQVRALLPMFATTPSLSPRRVIVIDAVDDLERSGANALLKSLEEPPAGTIFLLVSHAPGRLLPTIRSRCRLLRFDPLDDTDMRTALAAVTPDARADEIDGLVRAGDGAPGRALRYAGLELGAIETALDSIAREGDASNAARARLAKSLSLKAAQPRYEAFLDRAPTMIAQAAAHRHGPALRTALDAYDEARALASAARGLSLDQHGTVFEMAGIVARLAG